MWEQALFLWWCWLSVAGLPSQLPAKPFLPLAAGGWVCPPLPPPPRPGLGVPDQCYLGTLQVLGECRMDRQPNYPWDLWMTLHTYWLELSHPFCNMSTLAPPL